VPSPIAKGETVYIAGGIHGPGSASAITLGGRGDITGTHIMWQIKKGVTGVSSPILYDGLLYWVTENGILYCVDAESGDLVWRERLKGGVTYFAAPSAGDGKIYIPADDGQITVIEAGRQFELLATNSIGEAGGVSPTFSAGNIFIRGESHLYCIAAPEDPADAAEGERGADDLATKAQGRLPVRG
jgi:outer membrane protein assembly factor BamB